MAWYKHAQYLVNKTSDAFDTLHAPGTATPYSGIYRCEGCGHELVSEEKKPLPPQNHRQHEPRHGAIRWRLIVFADHDAKT